jgi:hypothetical protein
MALYVDAGYWVAGYAEGELNVIYGAASVNGTATVTANGGLQLGGSATINGVATLTANGVRVLGGIAFINGSATVTANGGFIAGGLNYETVIDAKKVEEEAKKI